MYCIKENIIRGSKYKYGFVLQTAHIFAQPCCRRVILYKVTSRKLFQLCNISMYILRTTLYVGWYTKLKNCILIMRWYLNEEWLSLIAMRNFKPYIIIIIHYSFLKYNPSCGLVHCIFIAFIFLMEQLRNMYVVSKFRIGCLDVMSKIWMIINLGKIFCYRVFTLKLWFTRLDLFVQNQQDFNFLFSKYSIVDCNGHHICK